MARRHRKAGVERAARWNRPLPSDDLLRAFGDAFRQQHTFNLVHAEVLCTWRMVKPANGVRRNARATDRKHRSNVIAQNEWIGVADEVRVQRAVSGMDGIRRCDTTGEPIHTVASGDVFYIVREIMAERREEASRWFGGFFADRRRRVLLLLRYRSG